MTKLGRPSRYTQAVVDEICERLAQGESLNRICSDPHLPDESTVRGWAMNDYNGFFAKYARSRDIALDMMADEVIEIADEASGDVKRDRLKFDARRWYLSKLAPKRYGDKMALEHSGNVGISQLLDSAEQARVPPVRNDSNWQGSHESANREYWRVRDLVVAALHPADARRVQRQCRAWKPTPVPEPARH